MLPGWRELLTPAEPYLVPLLVVLFTRIAVWAVMPLCAEDAYITFRYAQNLVFGNGLVYNPGERVMGFTSAPWALWNAVGLELFRHTPEVWARASSLIADVATVLIWGRLLGRHASRAAAWWFNAFFAGWPYFTAVAMSGMENSAMLALIGLGAALTARGGVATGPVLALLALWRPEGLASAVVLALRARRRDALVALAIAALAIARLALYYGSPVPQSVLAKARVYGTPGPLGGRSWWTWLVPFQAGAWPTIGELSMMLPFIVLMFPAFLRGVAELWRQRSTPLAGAVAAGLVVWIGYALSGATYFFWYLVVPLGAIAAASAVGLPHVVRGRLLPVAFAMLVAGAWTIAPNLYIGRAVSEYFAFNDTGGWLREHAAPGDRVVLEPLGLIGWDAPIHAIDEVGLVAPWVAERRTRGAGWYADVVAASQPRWLVIRRGVRQSGATFAGAGAPFRGAAERDSLFARFRLETTFAPQGDDAALEVWQRVR